MVEMGEGWLCRGVVCERAAELFNMAAWQAALSL